MSDDMNKDDVNKEPSRDGYRDAQRPPAPQFGVIPASGATAQPAPVPGNGAGNPVFGASPYAPAPGMAAPASEALPPKAPKEVIWSWYLWIGVFLLDLGSMVYTWFASRDLLQASIATAVDQAAQEGQTLTSEQRQMLESVAQGAMVFGLVVAVALFLLTVLFAFKLRQGKSWARTALTVLAAIRIVSSGAAIFGGTALEGPHLLASLLSLVSLALTAVATYFMWRPATTAYINASQEAQYAQLARKYAGR